MKKTLAVIASLIIVPLAQAVTTPVFSDNFNSVTPDPNWTKKTGGSLNGSTLLLTNFGGAFAEFTSTNGVALGLNAAAGQASFTLTNSGGLPKGFNFMVAATNAANVANAFARIDFSAAATSADGKYEIIWNNTGTTNAYSLASGSTGTLAGSNQFKVFRNGIVVASATGAATTFVKGDGTPANAFGFWNGNNQNPAIVDDFKIYNTLNVVGTLPPASAYLVYEDFTNATLNPTYWNAGGGFTPPTPPAVEYARLSSFGGGFGARGDSSGASGLDSNVGYASFTVSSNGAAALNGNFIAGHNTNFSTANGLVNVPFTTGGVGTYEVLWNNSGSTKSFTMPLSGWSGTIAGNSSVYIVNGDTAGAHWNTTTNALNMANINIGDAANVWGFWVSVASQEALIDNLRIAPTLTPGVASSPTLQISKSGSDVLLNWSGTGFKLQYQTNPLSTGLTTNWTDYALPAGTNPPVTVPISAEAEFFRLSQ